MKPFKSFEEHTQANHQNNSTQECSSIHSINQSNLHSGSRRWSIERAHHRPHLASKLSCRGSSAASSYDHVCSSFPSAAPDCCRPTLAVDTGDCTSVSGVAWGTSALSARTLLPTPTLIR